VSRVIINEYKKYLFLIVTVVLFLPKESFSGRIVTDWNSLKSIGESAIEEFHSADFSIFESSTKKELLVKSSTGDVMSSHYRYLAINPSIKGAKVRLLNVKKRYKKNIKIPIGKYKVSISMRGYFSKVVWLTVTENDKQFVNYDVVLIKKRRKLRIDTSILVSNIEITDENNKKYIYSEDLELGSGEYTILVKKTGYRSFISRINLSDKNNDNINNEIILNKRGVSVKYCETNMKISTAGSPFGSDGLVVSAELLIKNATVPEIYFSISEMNAKTSNNERVIKTELQKDYAYFDIIAPTSRSREDIKENNVIEIDPHPDHHVRGIYAVEKKGIDILLIAQYKMPSGVFIASSGLKEFMCNEIKNL